MTTLLLSPSLPGDALSARDRYTLDLKCPLCGRTGHAKVSESDRPTIYSGLGFRVDDLPEGFVLSKRGDTATETDISCSSCDVVAG